MVEILTQSAWSRRREHGRSRASARKASTYRGNSPSTPALVSLRGGGVTAAGGRGALNG